MLANGSILFILPWLTWKTKILILETVLQHPQPVKTTPMARPKVNL